MAAHVSIILISRRSFFVSCVVIVIWLGQSLFSCTWSHARASESRSRCRILILACSCLEQHQSVTLIVHPLSLNKPPACVYQSSRRIQSAAVSHSSSVLVVRRPSHVLILWTLELTRNPYNIYTVRYLILWQFLRHVMFALAAPWAVRHFISDLTIPWAHYQRRHLPYCRPLNPVLPQEPYPNATDQDGLATRLISSPVNTVLLFHVFVSSSSLASLHYLVIYSLYGRKTSLLRPTTLLGSKYSRHVFIYCMLLHWIENGLLNLANPTITLLNVWPDWYASVIRLYVMVSDVFLL